MIHRDTRPLSEQERQTARGGIPFLRTKKRKIDANADHVEVLDFTVLRAWTLITCDGPPCCPNRWLLQISPTELVYVRHWDHLDLIDDAFPGSQVHLARLPGTHHLLDARAEGAPIQREWPKDEMAIIPLYEKTNAECQVIQITELPPSVHKTLGIV
jgi:hypothetical protein